MDNIDKILRDKFKNYHAEAPQSVIGNVKSYYPKNKNLIPREITIAVSIVAIIALTYLVLNNFNKQPQNPEIIGLEQNINEDYRHNSKDSSTEINNEKLISEYKIEANKQISSKDYETKSEILRKKDEIFEHGSITICGNHYSLPGNINSENLILPDFLHLKEDKQGLLSIYAEKGGFYDVVYQSLSEKILYTDTMHIVFISHPVPVFNVEQNIECPGDNLIVYLNTPQNVNVTWETDGGVLKNNRNHTYSLEWDKPGKKTLQITTETPECQYITELDIFVPEPLVFSYYTKSSFCNAGNGELLISNLNYENSYFYLNGKKSLTREFKNLKSGNYNLEINYNENCVFEERMVIFDSIKISANFSYRQDFANERRYHFINNTMLDDEAYQFNPYINFIWTVNNKKFSDSDNPVYEFTESGDYNIKLKAYYNDECFDVFSQKISISGGELLIPNIFTPNDDGIDDIFIVSSNKALRSFHGIISSRTGEVIFEWNNISEGWDGKIKGINNASEGVYFYLIRTETVEGKIIEKKGTVQLVRE